MLASFTHTADLAATERDHFLVEAKYVLEYLELNGRPSPRLMDGLLVIYRRYDGSQGEMQRLLRPADSMLLADWLNIVFRNGTTPVPESALQACGLVHLAAAGMEAEELSELTAAWAAVPEYRESDSSFYRTPLCFVSRYVDFLGDFMPYLTAAQNKLARRLCLLPKDVFSADAVAAFVTKALPLIRGRFSEEVNQKRINDLHYDCWFEVFLAHYLQKDGLPEDYLATPFPEVVRNVLPQVWFDVPRKEARVTIPWVFSIGEPGFYHLAAGNSARMYLREVGISRATWRVFTSLPEQTVLSEHTRPGVLLWARGLGAGIDLCQEIPNFLPPGEEEAWEHSVRQLARMEVYWAADEGQQLLGYIYHMLRDQPDFRISAKRTDALLAAASAHYERIRQSQEAIRLERLAEQAAWDAMVNGEQEQRAQDYSRRHHNVRNTLQAEKWERFSDVKPYTNEERGLRIVELTNSWELRLEGERMQHCVGDYHWDCKSGMSSIWSLRHYQKGVLRSIVTIDIDRKKRRIVQARGRFNRIPDQRYQKVILEWALKNDVGPPAGWA